MINWMTAIGLAAAFCTTVAYLPQAIKTIKTKHTKDLSLGMYSIMTIGIALWLVYGILVGDLPITVANAVTLLFAGTILGMKLKYG